MKSVLLVGLGKFGIMMAKELNSLGHEVMAIDKDEKKVNEGLRYVTNAEIGDSTDPGFLSTLGIDNYDVCLVTISEDFQSSLETTSLLKEMGGRMVVARAERDVQEKFLLRNGADAVIDPERQAANWAAVRYTSDNVLDYIELDDDHAIYEVSLPDEWVGKNIGQIDIRKKYGINVLVIKEGDHLEINITPDTVFKYGQTLLVLGATKAVTKCFKL